MHHPTIRLLALLTALTLVLAACGDDDTSSATDDTTQDDGGEPAGDDSSEDDAEDAAEDAIDDQVGGDCGFLGEFATTGFDEAFDVEGALSGEGTEAFGAIAEEFQEVADAAPDEIQDAFSTLAEGMEALAEAFADVDFSDPSSIDPTVFEQIDDERYQEASEEVEAWMSEHCPDIVG
jgi:hypothetical protein